MMDKKLEKEMIEGRIALLESRPKDNSGIVAKLKRKLRALED